MKSGLDSVMCDVCRGAWSRLIFLVLFFSTFDAEPGDILQMFNRNSWVFFSKICFCAQLITAVMTQAMIVFQSNRHQDVIT